jgi:hypothetical protein
VISALEATFLPQLAARPVFTTSTELIILATHGGLMVGARANL